MIEWAKTFISGWKAGAGIAGLILVLGWQLVPLGVHQLRKPATENAAQIDTLWLAVQKNEEAIDTLRPMMIEVRCILRAQVREDDPRDCLLLNGNR